MKIILTILLSVLALLFAPIREAVSFGNAWDSYATAPAPEKAAALIPFFIPLPTGPPAPTVAPDQNLFINGLLVQNSAYGLLQDDVVAAPGANDPALNAVKYGVQSKQDMMRVSALSTSSAFNLAGIARDAVGNLLYYDASGGLPANVLFVSGIPVTPTGQLCVAFVP